MLCDDQNRRLLDALRHGPITSLQALDQLGIARASARVFDLRERGYDIRSRAVVVRNRFGQTCRVAEYQLATPSPQLFQIKPGRGVMHA
jgi:hypothetical protein